MEVEVHRARGVATDRARAAGFLEEERSELLMPSGDTLGDAPLASVATAVMTVGMLTVVSTRPQHVTSRIRQRTSAARDGRLRGVGTVSMHEHMFASVPDRLMGRPGFEPGSPRLKGANFEPLS